MTSKVDMNEELNNIVDKYIKLKATNTQVIEYINECINNIKHSDDDKVQDFITVLQIIKKVLENV